MVIQKKWRSFLMMAVLVAALGVFALTAETASAHGPEQCADIPANDPYQYAVCHHQSDQASPETHTREGLDRRSPGNGVQRHADLAWERQYASDPITTCIGVRIAAESMAFASVEDEIVDGPLVEAAARSRDCVTIRHGCDPPGMGLVRLGISQAAARRMLCDERRTPRRPDPQKRDTKTRTQGGDP